MNHRTTLITIRPLLPILLCALLWTPPLHAADAAELLPRRHWRVEPLAAHVSVPAADLLEVIRSQQYPMLESQDERLSFTLQVPPLANPAMLTFETWQRDYTWLAEMSADSIDGRDGVWQELDRRTLQRARNQMQKVILDPAPRPRWVRITITIDPQQGQSPPLRISDIALYDLDPAGRDDYWLAVGASIQQQSIRNRVFKQIVAERFGHDPVIFNHAIGGIRTEGLLRVLPQILADHPHARYVAIHIGGNNVSRHRPYPGGAEQIEQDLLAILRMVRDAGKVPILARLSYRAYGGENPVPPEENGSGPYVRNIYDPIIREHCPLFYDIENARGRVDPYTWFKDNPQELASDGVHLNPTGETSWTRLWAERAGEVIYSAGDANP